MALYLYLSNLVTTLHPLPSNLPPTGLTPLLYYSSLPDFNKMGCGTPSRVTVPNISPPEPKWKDEPTIIIITQPKETLCLCTDDTFLTLSPGSFASQAFEIPVQESGLLVLSPSSIMVAGGFSRHTTKDSSRCFTLTTSADLQELPSLPYPTRRIRLLLYEDSIYTIGGVRESEDSEITLQYSHNFCRLSNNNWEELSDMITGVEYPGCFAHAGKIYAVGGCYVKGMELEVIDSVQVYSIKEREWSLAKFFMPLTVYGHVVVPKDSGSFLLIGGVDKSGESNSMGYLIGISNAEEISPIPMGISTFFPYTWTYDGRAIYTVNDQKIVLGLNRLERKWNTLKCNN